jgi:Tfp pilus assembly ATPase PilU
MIQTSGEIGMQTMDQALADLYKASVITYEIALRRSQNPPEFERLCQGND